MSSILSGHDLARLAASHPPREAFGPESATPLLAFHLADGEVALGDWLRSLPCPVVGLGAGPLAPHCDVVLSGDADLAPIAANVAQAPLAAMTLVQLLRISEHMPEADALVAESLAYGVVQAGPEFQLWRRGHMPEEPAAGFGEPPLIVERDGGVLRLTLNRPEDRNAIGVEMRDALAEAFDLALIDDQIERIELRGAGRCFSVGGDVREFGLVSDPGTAHWIRTLRLPAQRLPRLRDRLEVVVQGAVIGAGVEIAAFARRVEAKADAWFQLPELRYGLIPGAGGTVSLPRRIGRQRTAYLALSMKRLPAAVALQWGLVDEVTG